MAKLLFDLLQERTDTQAAQSALFAAVEQRAEAGGAKGFTAEEATQDDAYDARLSDLNSQIARIERQQERSLQQGANDLPSQIRSRVSGMRERVLDKPWGEDTGHAFGEQLLAIAHATLQPGIPADPRLYEAAAQGAGEATPSDGGFLVGLDQGNAIELRKTQGEVMRRIKSLPPITSNSNGIDLKVVDESSRVAGSRFGGVQGYWVDEGTAPTATKPTFRKMELRLKKVAALGYATDELLADAAMLERIMLDSFGEELLFQIEDAIIEGTGAGQPKGVIGDGGTISITKETGQAAATVVLENINKMWARLPARYRSEAVWFINQDVEPQLEQLALNVGTGGMPVYLPPGGVADTPNARLKGRPVIPIEYCPTLGTVGDIILGAWSQYAYIEKGGVQQATSMHVAFTTDEMAFRATMRCDGQSFWRTTLTPFKGTNNLAPFVTLATRA